MRGVLLLIIEVATLYVAGIYRSFAGLFAAVAELLIFFTMLVASHCLRKKVSGSVTPTQEGMQRESVMPCQLRVDNRGRLPVWFWDARIVWRQGGQKGGCRLSGQVDGGGQTREVFEVPAKHCGFVTVTLKQLRVWDYMRLFHKKVKCRDGNPARRIPVFPVMRILQVESASGESMHTQGTDLTPLPLVGMDVREIQQYREYQEGDFVKNIHWKLSARSEELWVKEYSRSDDRRVGLFLDLVQRKPCDMEQLDAFYEIFLALLMGLLEN